MTPDERNILQPFLQDLAQSRGASKDPEAETMIQQAIQSNPDAVYLLVQHAILADQALHAAQAQIQQLQDQDGGAQAQGGGFLSQPPAQPYGAPSYAPSSSVPQTYAQPAYAQPGYGQPSGYAQSGYAQDARPVQSNPFAANSGLGGFLRSAGSMAAGVAAGDFLAEGLSNIFGGGGRGW